MRTRTTVLRDQRPVDQAVAEIVPGDVVLLSAGSLVPADAVVLEAADFFVSEAVLTGESFPVEKRAGRALPDGAAARAHELRLSRHQRPQRHAPAASWSRHRAGHRVRRASPHRLALRPPETEFDRGLRHFGYLLTSAMFVMVAGRVRAAHARAAGRRSRRCCSPIALAVGLSPELLPAILSVNLARGARDDGARTACWSAA